MSWKLQPVIFGPLTIQSSIYTMRIFTIWCRWIRIRIIQHTELSNTSRSSWWKACPHFYSANQIEKRMLWCQIREMLLELGITMDLEELHRTMNNQIRNKDNKSQMDMTSQLMLAEWMSKPFLNDSPGCFRTMLAILKNKERESQTTTYWVLIPSFALYLWPCSWFCLLLLASS